MAPLAALAAALLGATPPAACEAARAPVPADALEPGLRPRVEAYRVAWTSFCDAERPPAGALPRLLEQAEALAKDGVLAAAAAGGASWLPAIALDDETGGLFVDLGAFVEAAPRGSAEDRAFLPAYVALAGDVVRDVLPPWWAYVEGSGYAACLRLGEVSWVDSARRIEALGKGLGTASYRARVDRLAATFVEALASFQRDRTVCACHENPRALEGLDALARAERSGGPVVRRAARSAADAAAAVREGRTTIRWDRSADGEPGGCR